MNKFSFACLLTVLWGAPLIEASHPVANYSDTVAILQLLRNEEVGAARMYRAYARQALSEKHNNIESFFAALAWSANIRAENTAGVLRALGAGASDPAETGVRTSTTKLNLKLMSRVEASRMDRRYPMFIERIKPEGNAAAIRNVAHAWKVDTGHRHLAETILSSMEAFLGIGARIPKDYYVCRTCGAVDSSVPQLTCPVCGGPTSDYRLAHAKWRFYHSIEENHRLNDEEKGFAKRMYDHIHTASRAENVDLSAGLMSGEVYEKWGLGELRDFCQEEKAYIAHLPEMAAMWRTYHSIDTHSLDDADKAFLREMHGKFGGGPINLRRDRTLDRGRISPEVHKVLQMVEIVSGSTELADQELIFLRELITRTEVAG